jgi:hypothetical protein
MIVVARDDQAAGASLFTVSLSVVGLVSIIIVIRGTHPERSTFLAASCAAKEGEDFTPLGHSPTLSVIGVCSG